MNSSILLFFFISIFYCFSNSEALGLVQPQVRNDDGNSTENSASKLLRYVTSSIKEGFDSITHKGKNITESSFFRIAKTQSSPSTDSTKIQKMEEFVVKSLPNIVDPRLHDINNYAGNLNLGNTSDQLFFWLVSNKTNTRNKDSLVLWLNGGPGCTSMDGMFLENGPYMFKNNTLDIHMREFSFTNLVDVLYVDQPFGTGLSPINGNKYAKDYIESNEYLLMFLESFFNTFTEYKNRKLIIAGESQAGVYLLYLANSLLYQNKTLDINLSSVMIGNGWIDPLRMYSSYLPFISEYDLVSDSTIKKIADETRECTNQISLPQNKINIQACNSILGSFLADDKFGANSCINVYDLRLIEDKPSCGMSWPPGLDQMTKYMSLDKVQTALNAKRNIFWTECSNKVNNKISGDNNAPSVSLLPDVLEKVPVNLFVGDMDIICNIIGMEYMIGNLTWGGKTGFTNLRKSPMIPRYGNKTDSSSNSTGLHNRKELNTISKVSHKPSSIYSDWIVNGELAGTIHTERKLTLSVIYNASHMTGFDMPLAMLDLLSRAGDLDNSNILPYIDSKVKKLDDRSLSIKGSNTVYVLISVILLAVILFVVFSLDAKEKVLDLWRNRSGWVPFRKSSGFSDRGGPEYYQLNEIRRSGTNEDIDISSHNVRFDSPRSEYSEHASPNPQGNNLVESPPLTNSKLISKSPQITGSIRLSTLSSSSSGSDSDYFLDPNDIEKFAQSKNNNEKYKDYDFRIRSYDFDLNSKVEKKE
ncbi:hypothetical protein BB560_002397 [Smittium megazygosporum]|uniref:Pheromone-processing carboxypeptidase KEX1 n=1 Tax=Smittium megazygosporum TaxID=133381 RepID=A0A2T9ZEX2_9FUNG|nr:hypothetical protein BB560_002397 [Smittium megazygosporum]